MKLYEFKIYEFGGNHLNYGLEFLGQYLHG